MPPTKATMIPTSNSGAFPPPELPGFVSTTNLSATPAPGLSLTGVRFDHP